MQFYTYKLARIARNVIGATNFPSYHLVQDIFDLYNWLYAKTVREILFWAYLSGNLVWGLSVFSQPDVKFSVSSNENKTGHKFSYWGTPCSLVSDVKSVLKSGNSLVLTEPAVNNLVSSSRDNLLFFHIDIL